MLSINSQIVLLYIISHYYYMLDTSLFDINMHKLSQLFIIFKEDTFLKIDKYDLGNRSLKSYVILFIQFVRTFYHKKAYNKLIYS